jgi:CDP-2,3-bis-(O-geranylgeranyl)-sn-glycerol synthase
MDLVRILLFILPLYIANSCAMLLGGKTTLDFGQKFLDNKEIFGKGKTWKGTIFGTLAGTIVAIAIFLVFPTAAANVSKDYLLLGFLLSFGAILGDIAASFIKRRFSLARGAPVLLLDQLDFVAGGLLLASIITRPTITETIIIVLLTPIVHKMANFFAFKLKIKKVPW